MSGVGLLRELEALPGGDVEGVRRLLDGELWALDAGESECDAGLIDAVHRTCGWLEGAVADWVVAKVLAEAPRAGVAPRYSECWWPAAIPHDSRLVALPGVVGLADHPKATTTHLGDHLERIGPFQSGDAGHVAGVGGAMDGLLAAILGDPARGGQHAWVLAELVGWSGCGPWRSALLRQRATGGRSDAELAVAIHAAMCDAYDPETDAQAFACATCDVLGVYEHQP